MWASLLCSKHYGSLSWDSSVINSLQKVCRVPKRTANTSHKVVSLVVYVFLCNVFSNISHKRSPVKHQTCLRANTHLKPWAKYPCYWHSGFKLHKVQFLHLFCDNQPFYLSGLFSKDKGRREISYLKISLSMLLNACVRINNSDK